MTQTQEKEVKEELLVKLREIVSKTLDLPVEDVDIASSFLQLGGDSLTAIELVARNSVAGMTVGVADVMTSNSLLELASLVEVDDEGEEDHSPEPWSLIPKEQQADIANEVRKQCGLMPDDTIQDVYPGTALQEGLMLLGVSQPGSYMSTSTLKLAAGVDVARFKAAWEQTLDICEALRTRIILQGTQTLQAVIQTGARWEDDCTVESWKHQVRDLRMTYGSQLCRYWMLDDGEENVFGVAIHHAIFDGWSLRLILRVLTQMYTGQDAMPTPLAPYGGLIKYITQLNEAKASEYWRTQLSGASRPSFLAPQHVAASSSSSNGHGSRSHIRKIPFQLNSSVPITVTRASILRAAWAIVLVRHSIDTDETVFGATVTGRQAAVTAVERMAGPAICTVPVRVKVRREQAVTEFLQDIQAQAVGMIPFEQFGLQNIARLGPEIREACDFNTIMVVQAHSNLTDETFPLVVPPFTDAEYSNFFNYPLAVQCWPADDEVTMQFVHDPSVVTAAQTEVLAERFDHVVQQLLSALHEQSAMTLDDIDILAARDCEEIWRMNCTVPPVVERCVHEVIAEQIVARSSAQAVCAWDGEMTYAQLDQLSNKLSNHLVALGVQHEDVIALCFEKSMWMVVAMLAVLKSGAAFAPLDPEHPQTRHDEILKQANARAVLSSSRNSRLFDKSARTVVSVDETSIQELSVSSTAVSGQAQPTDTAYIFFTSGSTGVPKGVVMEHRAVSTGCLDHGRTLGFTPEARFLQFASFTFDVSITEIITTLMYGGTVCIPSEDERRDSLAAAITRLGANWAFLTPTVASLLNPEDVPSLKRIILGSETVSKADCDRWVGTVEVINTYGPTECCVLCTAYFGVKDFTAGLIGKPVTSSIWLVDPDDHNKLSPLGSIGELLVEGPILARGYLDNPVKTSAAFIENPAWLLCGNGQYQGRQGRLYKTGDLAYWGPNGNLIFLGRKDSQVKVRGQRVELGEIEHHLRECLPDAPQLAVELITPEGGNKTGMLAAFVQLEGDKRTLLQTGNMVNGNSALEVLSLPEVEKNMMDRLPSYMRPDVYLAISALPITSSAKTDRKRLRDIGSSLSAQHVAKIQSASETPKRMPSTETERALQQLWARVLNIKPEMIGSDDSFFRLGGDSITAMQVSASARSVQLHLSTRDILRRKTIADLARHITPSKSVSNNTQSHIEDPVNTPFGLTPIQELYLRLEPTGTSRFDQSLLLELRTRIPRDLILSAIEALIERHSMLRARFRKVGEGRWQQHISDSTNISSIVEHVQPSDIADVSKAILQSRGQLDIQNGPVIKVVLFDAKEHQSLFFSVHHFAIDLVSWRVLVGQLETLLRGQTLAPATSLPFQAWQALQADHTGKVVAASRKSGKKLLQESANPSQISYWGLDSSAATAVAITTEEFMLDQETTSALLGKSNDTFRTRPVELMIAALIHSFGTVFTDRKLPAVFNETHGREPWDDDIDLSQTVGWFTTMFPVQLQDTGRSDLLETIRRTKDCIRSFEHGGQLFLASQLIDEDKARSFTSNFPVELIFNYQGAYQQLERDDSLFNRVVLPEGSDPTSPVGKVRMSVFDVSIVIQDGCAHVTMEHAGVTKHTSDIQAWLAQFKSALTDIPHHLYSRDPEWTLSDLPLAFSSYKDLDAFVVETLPGLGVNADDVEDIYPCSPMQEGILASQSKDPHAYRICVVVEATFAKGADVDCTRLERAWKAVVRRHSLLRTLLVHNVPGSPGITNVVLKSPQPSISTFKATASEAINIAWFRARYDPVIGQESGLQHHLSICQVEENQRVYLCLDINHAIMDGQSRDVMMRDFQMAYSGDLELPSASFKNVVSHLKQVSLEPARQYWATHLQGVEPCHFPSLIQSMEVQESESEQDRMASVQVTGLDFAAIQAFCEAWEMTPATMIQAAWAMVLRRYTGSDDVSFGILSSGRDAPIDGINDVVGPLVTMLTSRIRLPSQQTVLEYLRSAQSDHMDSLTHQMFSLADVHTMLQLGASSLFNTVLSIQRMDEARDSATDVAFQYRDGADPTEYDIVIGGFYNNVSMNLSVTYQKSCMHETQARSVAESLVLALNALATQPSALVYDLDLTSTAERQRLWAWNNTIPETIERCAHDLIAERVALQPDAQAICAWDGEMTYRQLDEASSRLAGHLIHLGVQPEDIVPFCFEKSKWVVVAMLAILKSGGAFAPLDPEHPQSRHKEIFKQTEAMVLVTSEKYSTLWGPIKDRTVVAVSEKSIQNLPETSIAIPSSVQPENPAYVFFTSGSTGVPKGVVLEHKSVSTGCTHHGKAFGLSPATRFIQFSSYTFDACITEIITNLMYGGCVCIPSEEARRNNLAGAITEMQANRAYLTPTVASLLEPDSVPSLQRMNLGGEKVTSAECRRWEGKVDIINAYGPTECTVLCTAYFGLDGFYSGLIGKPIASAAWVVDPLDHNMLAPIGSIGEMLMEGPILARGYLKNQEKTDAAFISNPTWLVQGGEGCAGRQSRLYKTGDLVYLTSEGNIVYIGRKDTQIKIRGQRIELGEVEHHLQDCMPGARQVAVEVITPGGGSDNAILAAFVQLEDGNDSSIRPSDAAGEDSAPAQRAFFPEVDETMGSRVPSYMVPSAYFTMPQLPVAASGKTDRKRLRQIGASFSVQELAGLQTSDEEAKQPPTTEAEKKLQKLWSQVLSIEPELIGRKDGFFQLGGDSIGAMKLVGLARKAGMSLTVASIFQNRTLESLASSAADDSIETVEEISAFSLVGKEADLEPLLEEVALSCGVDTNAIEDIYPCSPLQEGLISLTSKRAGDYIMQTVLELHAATEEDKFRDAWEHVVQATPALRTRIVQDNKLGLLQVVLKQGISWVETNSLKDYLSNDKSLSMALNDPLARYAMIADRQQGKRWFVGTIHHALYDGWSLPRVVSAVTKAYAGMKVEKTPGFNAFIKYLGQQDEQSTVSYWQTAFADCQAPLFPPLPPTVQQPFANATATYQCPPLPRPEGRSDITTSSLVRAAWAIIVSRHTNSDDVVFGATITGRNAPVPGIEDMVGTTFATVPVRARVMGDQAVSAFLSSVQQQATEMIPYEQTGLQLISKFGPGAQHACSFQTLLVVQPEENGDLSDKTLGEWHGVSDVQEFTTYALMLQIALAADGVHITASFDPRVIESWLVDRMLRQFGFILQQLAAAPLEYRLADVEVITDEDRQQLWAMNSNLPSRVEWSIHDKLAEQVSIRRSEQAVCAWDGEMTYNQLDRLSNGLASRLIELDIRREEIVPICFEKSMWTIVAMLAVLKTGGTFAPLNPEHPRSRQEAILEQTEARIILTSSRYSMMWENSPYTTITVSGDTVKELSNLDKSIDVEPSHTAYVIPTSGSTGVPKTVVMEHGAVLTSCYGHGKAFQISSDTRSLQFASYTFDVCITEIFTTLLSGGCVCVPSEEDRRTNLATFMETRRVNWALLTPTVSRLLDPSQTPSLKVLVCGGEQLSSSDCQKWAGKCQLINTYGVTECGIWNTSYPVQPGYTTGTVGKSFASASWVVDANDHNKLAPLGSIGELLAEGPTLAREYLKDPTRTEAVFVQDPAWLLAGTRGYPGRGGRLYKTGDLVYYKSTGDLVYVARKDDQVKVRGQRVELGEIEHHLRQTMPEAHEIAVEVITRDGDKRNAMLAAFFKPDTDASHTDEGSASQVVFLPEVDKKMADRVPSHMIPDAYFAVSHLPMTVSGKTDRKRLREIGGSFSAQQLAEVRASVEGPKRLASTETECTMQGLWSKVLDVAPDLIGLDDNFFRLGGDSIAAMKLVGEARRMELHLTVADVFQNPTLTALASFQSHQSLGSVETIAPFALLDEGADPAQVRTEAANSCNIDPSLIKDIYPCSPLQEGLISLTSKKEEGDYIMQSTLELRPDIDEHAFKAAWEQVAQSTAALRTRIVQNTQLGLLQVVTADEIQWLEADGLQEYLASDKSLSMGLGDPLARYALITEKGKRWFVSTIHHALYDGWSIPRVIDAVTRTYHGIAVEERPGFNAFIKYLSQQDHEASTEYWQRTLADCQATLFPSLPPTVQQPLAESRISYQCSNLPTVSSDTTLSTLVRAAWAIVASRYVNADDVVFGATVSGRNAPVPGIENMIGITVATVPLRLRVSTDQTVRSFLLDVQQQSTDMIPHEQTGLQQIAKLGSDTQHACGFQTLLVVQPVGAVDDNDNEATMGQWHGNSGIQDFTTYALVLQCALAAKGPHITVNFDPNVVDRWLVEKIIGQFDFVMQQLANSKPEDKVESVSILTSDDEKELWARNAEKPATVERYIHDLIFEKATQQPNAPAVCAWDGEMTYKELQELSTRLAHHLIELGVTPGDIVALCFEKSMWMTVATLAVLLAGGVIVPLDPEHPQSRHEEVFKQTQASIVLTSNKHSALWQNSTRTVVVVDKTSTRHFSNASPIERSVAQSTDPAYIIFTSGSTGLPKGVVMEHGAATTGCLAHGEALGYGPGTRVLQFAPYTFDVWIDEVLTVLLYGGCTCIPSDGDRRDRLSQVIHEMEINCALLTPSVARLLTPSFIPSLKTLVLGGEQVSTADWAQWKDHAQVINAYGPAEACVCCCVFSDTQGFQTGKIGRSIASVSWVVNPENHNELAPPGSVGELLVEGPILAREYLGRPEMTEAAFIENPPWLLKGGGGQRGRQGRLYKTGDLVSQSSDGSLVYVGRKDNQVKIRGQRVELGEIEQQLRQCPLDGEAIAVDVVTPKGGSALLAAFVRISDQSFHKLKQGDPADGNLAIQVVALPDVDDYMTERLPQYMVPDIYFAVSQIQMTASGKIDRKWLREVSASFSAQQLADIRASTQGPKRLPSTEAETMLQQLWARVLNIKPETIGLDDSFFRLGGDSITAMQLSASARTLGLQFSTRDVFQRKTIGELTRHASTAKSGDLTRRMKDPVNTTFGLTPVQELYLRLEPTGMAHFDQAALLQLQTQKPVESIISAVEVLVQHHSMLRARFSKTSNDRWQQYISEFTDNSSIVQHVHSASTADIQQAIQQCRGKLDVQNGPVMAAVLFETVEQGQMLFVSIHHLVVDLVSWRILLEDLESLLLGQALIPLVSTPFQAWHAIQAESAAQDVRPIESIPCMDPSQLSYWGIDSTILSQAPSITEEFKLDREMSSTLLGNSNEAFRTRPVELMIGALIHSFAAAFPDRDPPPIFNETHGRESQDESIDLSRTVGWFTSLFPVQASTTAHRNLLEAIRKTKDHMRSYKNNGQSYLASHFVSEEATQNFVSAFPVEVVFNFQGAYQQLERDGSLFKSLPLPQDSTPKSTERVQFSAFTVSIVIKEGCVHATVEYSSAAEHKMRIQDWVQRFKTTLTNIPDLLRNRKPELTLSDSSVFKFYEDLDRFQSETLSEINIKPKDIEDVYACIPMQEGILASQSRDLNAYRVCAVIEAVSTNNQTIDCIRLQKAWETVVQRHSLLRTLLVRDVPGSMGICNVVLNNPPPSVSFFKAAGDVVDISLFRGHYNPIKEQERGLQHHLAICQLDNEKVYLCLDINHAIIDAHSRDIIVRDLQAAYDGLLDSHGVAFKNVVSYLEEQSQEVSRQYWASHLHGLQPCYFPSIAESDSDKRRDGSEEVPSIDSRAIHAFCEAWEVTPATIIQTAWAMVLSRYAGSADTCFGTLSSGRDAPIDGIDDIVGPLVTMLTSRVRFDEQSTVMDVLRSVQSDYLDALAHQTFSLSSVHNMLELGTSPLFNTSLSIQRMGDDVEGGNIPGVVLRFLEGEDPTEYDIIIGCRYNSTSMEVTVSFRTTCMSNEQAKFVAQSLGNAIAVITAQPQALVHGLDILSASERSRLWKWNNGVPPKVEHCVHDLITKRAMGQPTQQAVCAGDGEMQYGQLDQLSTRLASHLIDLGIGCEDVVPLCFEKSMWAIVAMLAVLKAGAAFTPLDPHHPTSRHQSILKQTGAKTILTSEKYSSLLEGSSCTIVTVSEASVERLPSPSLTESVHYPAQPANAAYIIFTSGSTGVPKGVVMEHGAVSTGCLHHGEAFKMTSQTRFLQFAAFTFDISITEIITTLIYGGSVCIPSETDRRDNLAKAITDMRVNQAYLTPTVANLIDPESVPSLKVLTLGGEEVRSADCERWSGVEIINAYGPTEACVLCTVHVGVKDFKSGLIGKPVASAGWVVSLEDHNVLVPVGAIGELLVEGPILARGYLHDSTKTEAAFIEDPAWLLLGGGEGCPGRHGRLYKTGDLVRYRPDGSLMYVSRIDGQIKVRGQRVELGEIEHHLRDCVPGAKQVAVEVISPGGHDNDNTILAGFLELDNGQNSAVQDSSVSQDGEDCPAAQVIFLPEVDKEMGVRVPDHMTPNVYFAVSQLPVTVNGKTDRKTLRKIGASFSPQQLAEMRAANEGPSRPPSTEAEKKLQSLWAQLLHIDEEAIGLTDSFFRLGGDSVAAMKLVGEARRVGLHLTVTAIFEKPTLQGLAAWDTDHDHKAGQEVSTWSLLGEGIDQVQLRKEAAASCNLDSELIEDVYPCSPLQEGLISLTSRRSGDYIMQSVLELRPDINEHTFRAAWEQVVRSTEALRTRIVQSRQHNNLGLLQVVSAEPLKWAESNSLHDYLKKDKFISMELGDALARYAIIKEAKEKRWFVWTAHHALYDGYSLYKIIEAVTMTYYGSMVEKQLSYNAFIKYLSQQDQRASEEYWRSSLADCQAATFPQLPPTVQQPVANATVTYQCPPLPDIRGSDTTAATLVRAAWAVTAGRHTNSDDVVFGATVTGRNAPIVGIETMIGTTIATVPVRVRISGTQTVSAFLQGLQQQSTQMIPHEQTGLQRIAKLGPGAKHACSFQTLLVVQPGNDARQGDKSLGEWHGNSQLQDFSTYGLALECTLGGAEGPHVIACFDPHVIEHSLVEKMLRQFSFVLEQLIQAAPQDMLADISVLTPEDKEQLWAWNNNVPPADERCLHDLFSERATQQPGAQAIFAWDGEMTYSELDHFSTTLAGHLINLGIGPEDVVPLCFEKSMWAVVAMLAVLKAGGAFAPINPDHPRSRHEEIFALTEATVVLTSMKFFAVLEGPARTVIDVSEASMAQMANVIKPSKSPAKPNNAAYILFTSGSTGVPKGVVLEHRTVSTSCLAHGRFFELSPETRCFQFFTFTFDPSIAEIFTTLLYGGTVCIPSEGERRDNLAKAIADTQANMAILTPTVAGLLDPDHVPNLRKLILGGEKIKTADYQRWANKLEFTSVYGPTECCILCTAYMGTQHFQTGAIGRPIASAAWVVDPDNTDKLVPIGSIGELLMEGPLLARGYLKNADKTAAAFIEDPAWLLEGVEGRSGRQGRLYKTGDLVYYGTDGNLIFAGRKDDQVKVRGQRVELGEVEYHLRSCVPDAQQMAVDIITPKGAGNGLLAAFLQLSDERRETAQSNGSGISSSSAEIVFLPEVETKIASLLPGYMVPDVYFSLPQLPITASGKTDRRRLREIGASFSAQHLAELRASSTGPKRLPSTEIERTMQKIWAQVLNIKLETISMDDSFFTLGGDSISAMQLSATARSFQLHVSTRDIFKKKTIAELVSDPSSLQLVEPLYGAEEHTESGDSTTNGVRQHHLQDSAERSLNPTTLIPKTVPPFSMLSSSLERAALSGLHPFMLETQLGKIVDILPATYLQAMFARQGVEHPAVAFTYLQIDIGPDVDAGLLRDSCQKLVDHFSILRTQFAHFQDKWWQIVLSDVEVPFRTVEVDGALEQESHLLCMQETQGCHPLDFPVAFSLVRSIKSQKMRLIMRLSHAQYDGYCVPMMLKTLVSIYRGEHLRPTVNFSTYVAHARAQQPESADYWRELLQGSQLTRAIPTLQPRVPGEAAPRAILMERSMYAPVIPKHFTMSSVVSTAWAVVLSQITGEKDVVFAQVVAGRNSEVSGISELVGPCINAVPIRASLRYCETSEELIGSVQNQYISRGQADSMGWDEIVEQCTEWTSGPALDSIFEFQNLDLQPEVDMAGASTKAKWFENPFTVPDRIEVACIPQGDKLSVWVAGNTHIITAEVADRLLDMLLGTISALTADLQAPLASYQSSLPVLT